MDPGRKIGGKLTLQTLLNRGELSSVYVAREIETPNREFAAKEMVVMSEGTAHISAAEFVFTKEIPILRNLNHPGIAKFYEGWRDGARFYLISEFVEGTSLEKIMELRENKPFTLKEALPILKQLAEVIIYLNQLPEKSIPYHDLNPRNILLTSDGSVKIIDMGVSRLFCPENMNYRSRSGFNSPEVVSGCIYDEKSDIYVLGSIGAWLVTGTKPIDWNGRYPDADALVRSVGKDMGNLLNYCLAPRDLRRESPEEFLIELEKVLQKKKDKSEKEAADKEEEERKRKARAKSLRKIGILLLLLIILVPIAIFVKNFTAAAICKENSRRLAQAVEDYGRDHHGKCPEKLEDLVPEYIPSIPLCPGSFKDTYSGSYKSYNYRGFSYCKFMCKGKNHVAAFMPENMPRYNSSEGLKLEASDLKNEINPVEMLLEAYELDDAGKYDQALEKLKTLTLMKESVFRERVGFDKYIIFWNMARILAKMGRNDEALAKYRTTADLLLKKSLVSFDCKVIETLIKDMSRLGYGDEAVAFYDRLTNKYVTEINVPKPEIVLDMAGLYEKLNYRGKAVSLYRRYLSKCPDEEKYFVQAEILRLKGLEAKDEKSAAEAGEGAIDKYVKYLNQPTPGALANKAEERIEGMKVR